MLNLRGSFETIFLGSLTIEKVLINLFPKIKIEKRNRFSNLSFLPKNSLSKLNPRSAIIAFNINSIYEIAESLRMHKGGAAVVLGSLSPRTRNAQVEIYEDKKVDYLVATDAIGMGLNLNIDHVSFSALQKFDGRYNRDLMASELGQIAGRAGRYFNDGTFGCLKSAGLIDPLTIQSIEEHKFDSIKKIYWRNSNINFNSVESVKNSLKQYPVKNFFIHKKNAEDEINFRTLSEDQEIIPYLNNADSINLLWDVCRIPDFQKIFNDSYLSLLKDIFLILATNDGGLGEAWLREKIMKFENYQGGIEELSVKIASIRTWTYISNQSNWVKDFRFWQEKTQQIENNLSDRLHESLTSRFVDFSASFFVNSKNSGKEAIIEVDKERTIKLNGQKYGYINGFDLEIRTSNSESLFSLNHVKKSIRTMIEDKINNFLKAPLDSLNLGQINNFKINDIVNIYWGDEPIGVISKGKNIFSPVAEALSTEFLESEKKILITHKLQQWLNEKITDTLKPIKDPIDETISSEVRAVVYNVFNNLGTMEIDEYLNTIKNLNIHDKASISKTGLRVGAKFFFMPNFLKKFPMELNALLWKIYYESKEDIYYPLPNDGRVSFTTDKEMPDSYWKAIGYKCLDNFVLRVDVFERIFFIARQKIKYGPFVESSDMMNPLGCNSDQLQKILTFCGFGNINLGDNKKLFFYKQIKQRKTKEIKLNQVKQTRIKQIKEIKLNQAKEIKIKPRKIKTLKTKINKKSKGFETKTNNEAIPKESKADPNSPFAVLEKLL